MEIKFLMQEKASKEEETRWYHHCQSENIPMVKAIKRKKYGDVDWDYITLHPDTESFLFSQEKYIEEKITYFIQQYATKKTDFRFNALVGKVSNLPVEFVSDFALDICNTLSEAYKKYERESK